MPMVPTLRVILLLPMTRKIQTYVASTFHFYQDTEKAKVSQHIKHAARRGSAWSKIHHLKSRSVKCTRRPHHEILVALPDTLDSTHTTYTILFIDTWFSYLSDQTWFQCETMATVRIQLCVADTLRLFSPQTTAQCDRG